MILKRCHDVNGPDEERGKMRRANRIPIIELNQHITCTLCKGYFIDATTIIECLHTFCRSCIVQYLETNKYCPVCDVQVHKSKPLVNIRPDKTLQDVVYKLVPRLFQNEMQRRRDFYMAHPEVKPSGLEQRGETSYQHLLTPEETICLSLNYHESTGPPRYLRCPAAVSVAHLQKLIRAKYDLSDSHRIDILHNQDTLHTYLTLMDIAYIYLWRRKGPLELTYRIYENRTKRLKIDDKEDESLQDSQSRDAALVPEDTNQPEKSSSTETNSLNNNNNNNNNNWKEVQLRISENGEISVTDIIQDNSEVKRTVTESESIISPSVASTTIAITQSDAIVTNIKGVTDGKQESALKTNDIVPKPNDTANVAAIASDTKQENQDASKEISCNSNITQANVEKPEEPAVTTSQSDVTLAICTTTSATVLKSESIPSTTSVSTTNCTITTSTSLTTTCSVVSSISTQISSKIESKSPPSSTVPKQTLTSGIKTVTTPSTSCTSTTITSLNVKIDDHQCNVPVAIGVRMENKGVKHKLDDKGESKHPDEPPVKQPKQTILNHTLSLHKLSNNHPLKKHSQMSNEVMPSLGVKPPMLEVSQPPTIINKGLNNQPNRPGTPATHKWKSSTPGPPCYMPKTTYSPIINVPKLQASVSKINELKQLSSNNSKPPETKISPQIAQPNTILNNKALIKSKPSTPIGYKTLRDPPKTWNPQISRANLNRAVPDAKCGDLKNVRPPKFFKLRNNMPRYLGNPASGVKPMYQVQLSPEKEKTEAKSDKSEIKKHSIVKIDPKTLKPISERAPETSNLSRTSENKFTEQDLKINTSSVPILNPLKLQGSPKSDRKSPKSPHSPKTKSSSPPNRREKLNLSFTPPNPFIPNLTSPNMNPNQFLFTAGPPTFPPYDPRVMAAYHTFLYGQQRMSFNPAAIPGLNLDLNQRNNFDIVSPTSPKLMQNKPTSTEVGTPSTSNHKNNIKKSKETNKNEKSLQNAVEKLTLNKIKEVAATKLGLNEKEQATDTNLMDVKITEQSEGTRQSKQSKDGALKSNGSANGGDKTTIESTPSKQALDAKNAAGHVSGDHKGREKPKENSDTNNVKEKIVTADIKSDRKDAPNSNNDNLNNNNNNTTRTENKIEVNRSLYVILNKKKMGKLGSNMLYFICLLYTIILKKKWTN
ncbi:hypothetical protein Trydic_g20388 [Trypoxylus dichotomus]